MTDQPEQALRATIQEFIDERLEIKSARLRPDDPELASKRANLENEHQFDAWIDDAARRVAQLQVVTHTAKATHPDAKGSSLYCPTDELPDHPVVGSHSLAGVHDTDVVGNAAALDVYKLLRRSPEGSNGRTLLARALDDDRALAAALDGDEGRGWERMRAFATITRSSQLRGDYRLKQIYWLIDDDPTDNDDFHLLIPLYSSVLAHRLYRQINEDRFGEAAQEARKARREGRHAEHGFRDYPNLGEQHIGGSNAQNVSQLNAQRSSGRNYLLPSLPPSWDTTRRRPPLRTESALRPFSYRPGVQRQLEALKGLLADDPPANLRVRRHRDGLIMNLIDELIAFTAEMNQLTAGWSTQTDCQLDEAEAFWLDAGRSEIDADFANRRDTSDWPRQIRDRFARWLNSRLGDFPVADPEHEYWADLLKPKMDELEEALPHV